jgi:hypothetical protein
MDEKLEQLQINKLIQEFSFLKSDEELKKELIEHNQNIFLELVNEELSNLNPEQIKEPDDTIKEPKSVKVESKIDMSTVSENTKVKIKKIYREIVKKTHPDKVNSEELNELYIKATEYYVTYDIFELYFISKTLNIKIKLSLDETNTLNQLIELKKSELKAIETSFIWLWLNAQNEDEKNVLVHKFLKVHYLK